jgi:hypothetical protein
LVAKHQNEILKAPASTGTFRLATECDCQEYAEDRAKDDRNLGVDRAQLPQARGKELIEGVMAVTYHTPEHSVNAEALHEKVERMFKDQGERSPTSRGICKSRRLHTV